MIARRRSAPRGLGAAVVVAAATLAITLGVAGAQAAGGDLDPSFGSGGTVLTDFGSSSTDLAYAVAVQPDGKIVAVGNSGAVGSHNFALARYTTSGALDAGFGTGGKVPRAFGSSSYVRANAVAIQRDGKIVVAGYSSANGSYDFALARYTKRGTLDPGFGTGGRVLTDLGSSSADFALAVAIEPNGKIVAAGYSTAKRRYDFALARYTERGTLDQGFGTGGKVLTRFGSPRHSVLTVVAIQPDGKIVAAGFNHADGRNDFALARYTTRGTLDQGFGAGGKVLTHFGSSSSNIATAVAVRPDGKIVVAGRSGVNGPGNDFALARYRKSGALDPSFGKGGKVLTDFGSLDFASAVAIQKNGKVVVAGASAGKGSYDFAVARYTKSGALDPGFGSGGKVLTDLGSLSTDLANAVAIEPDGKIVVAGYSNANGDPYDFALVRYLGH